MELFQLERIEKKNPAKKKNRVPIHFGKKMDEEGSLIEAKEDKLISKTFAIDKRRRHASDIPTDRERILERLQLQDVVEEIKTKSSPIVPIPTFSIDILKEVNIELDADEEKTMEKMDKILPEMVEKPEEKEIADVNKEEQKETETETETEKEKETEKETETETEKETETETETETEKVAVKKRKLILKKTQPTTENIDITTVKIGDKIAESRLPKQKKYTVKISPYYMNNRKLYIQKLAELFKPYRDEILAKTDEITCESLREIKVDFDLLTHQKVVRDYLNLFTPYRGVLLYHSLGSGKSCSSIAIAEGMKSAKKIILMTPASLKMNFFNELKKCGDPLYRKNQFWEFVSTDGQSDLIPVLAKTMSLDMKYIRENRGAWVVDISKPSNVAQLSSADQVSLNKQIDEMIRAKYYDINYNGMNRRKLREMTQNGTINPFDHSVVIIDEAHNFVSRICNKLKEKTSVSYQLYNYLMDAIDVRIVLVSGTPIINYPNEIGVLFNIIRGYIKTWVFHLQTNTSKKINTEFLLDLFRKNGMNTADYVQYSGNVLTITRNPYGFINKYSDDRRPRGGTITKNNKKTKKREPKLKQSNLKRKTKKTNNSVGIYEIKKELLVRKPVEEIPLSYEETLEYHHEQQEDIHKGGANEFENYIGMKLDETGNISDVDFQQEIIRILSIEGIRVVIPEGDAKKKGEKEDKKAMAAALLESEEAEKMMAKNDEDKYPGEKIKIIPPIKYKCLPDTSKEFLDVFVDTTTGTMINTDMFKRRILGLSSYYRSSQEQLMPAFVMTDHNEPYHKVVIDMSEYQFSYYYKVRKEEIDKDKKRKTKPNVKDAITSQISSTYRIFSRSACNFAFPNEYPRPMPDKKNFNINELNALTKKMRSEADDYIEDDEGITRVDEDNEKAVKEEDEDEQETKEDEEDEPTQNYIQRIEETLEQLRYDPLHPKPNEFLTREGLEMYSPKFLRMLENIQDPENEGLHMLYSQFRTVEGIGLFQLVLEAAGFAQLKVKQIGDSWEIDETPEDADKPKFVLYTGTETKQEKEILLNIYNSTWDYIPPEMADKLREKNANNHRGEIVKLLMITSSGAEGINLRNTRFVHIMEPYWNIVRIEQVIGRARRICSHQDLPEEMRTVKVFMYLTRFTEQQRKDDKNIEIMINDISRIDAQTPITTDEALLETAQIKQQLNIQILKAVKESAMDCNVYIGTNKEENLVCYGYGTVRSNQFGTFPNLEIDKGEKIEQNADVKIWKARVITDEETGIQYAINMATSEVFDLDSYKAAVNKMGEPILVGNLVKIETRDDRGFKNVEKKIQFLEKK